ncbi:hypothetical protein V2O64_14540 [Verrucomicrobiaceae bacterium 227]
MKRLGLLLGSIVVLGSLILSWLSGEEKRMLAELSEIDRRGGQGQRARSKISKSSLRIADVSVREEVLRSESRLDKIESLMNLSSEEIKALVDEIFRLEIGKSVSKKTSQLYEPLMELACAMEPEWFLERTEEDWKAGKQLVRWRGWDERAFQGFLRLDPIRAIDWYERGRFDRPIEIYEKHELREMAVAELLSRDPGRALGLMNERLYPKDGGFRENLRLLVRFENLQQVQKVGEALSGVTDEKLKKGLESFVVTETYRLAGRKGLEDLMKSDQSISKGRLGHLGTLANVDHGFRSEKGMAELRLLLGDASEEVEAKMMNYFLMGWAWDDLPAASAEIMRLPTGKVRQAALEGLIHGLAEFDPGGARELIPEIESEKLQKDLEKWIQLIGSGRE